MPMTRTGEVVVSSAPKPTPRLDSLTGMRFLAALAVFGYHVSFLFLAAALVELSARSRPGGSLFLLHIERLRAHLVPPCE